MQNMSGQWYTDERKQAWKLRVEKDAMGVCWVSCLNDLKIYGRWAIAEFRDVYQMESDLKVKIEAEFNKMIEKACQS